MEEGESAGDTNTQQEESVTPVKKRKRRRVLVGRRKKIRKEDAPVVSPANLRRGNDDVGDGTVPVNSSPKKCKIQARTARVKQLENQRYQLVLKKEALCEKVEKSGKKLERKTTNAIEWERKKAATKLVKVETDNNKLKQKMDSYKTRLSDLNEYYEKKINKLKSENDEKIMELIISQRKETKQRESEFYYEAKKQKKYILTLENKLEDIKNSNTNNHSSKKIDKNKTEINLLSTTQELENFKTMVTSLEKDNQRKDRLIIKLNNDLDKLKSKYADLKLQMIDATDQKIYSDQTKK